MAALKVKKNKRSILVAILVFAVICYFVATFISLRIKVRERREANAVLQSQYNQQVEANEQLSKVIEEGDEADYIERIAREDGYAKPGERVYYDSTAS
ncbi:MAG: septum formation initiator family protein [Clostridia bacterium]|nr:septum formation initiator family protein [Clostridia bacterium]